MNLALDIMLAVFGALCVFGLIAYLPRLIAWFGSARPQKKLVSDVKHRIAVVVPARNESKAIGDFLASMDRQTYDRDYFDFHVIVADEKDPTIDMVKAAGGYTWVKADQTCKGDALDYCLQSLMSSGNTYDAYLIVDADCMPADDYVEQMNNAMASDRQIIQSRRAVKNYLIGKPALSWSAACNGMIWTIIDGLGNRYKSDHNITCMTIGTGIMLRHDVVETLGGWPYRQTLTEDMELMNDSAIRKFSTFYYEYATLYLEESTSLRVTNKRRTRWLTGLIDSKRIYHKRLKASTKTKEDRRNAYFVRGLWPVYRYIGICVVATAAFAVTSAVLGIIGSGLWLKALVYGCIALGMIYLSFLVLTAFCMIVDRKYILLPFWKKVILFFAHPIFYMGYIPIVTRALFFKNKRGWEVIERIDCSLCVGQKEKV